ncbi:hypothetical protein EJP67_32290 [Variovorax guangxiensis]|uniref:DUF4129 domain-containing protein n=1 Tax=Variovorax guangxiensis TaxID=1775474 RepID=A0A433MVC6_9BURK|nr:hypothetical protein [Variovorax guangxiensis]RUR71734.1 hypothetical protein EJP67_32290 [Variovorax guangxiensis]
MRVDGLAIALRPRPMAEAADLGAQLVRSHARSVWRTFLPVHIVMVLLALGTVEIAGWLPSLLIFWLKPWLDRSLLFVHSRAVFGQETRWSDLWANRRAVWGGQLLRTLLWRRFSPWRSLTQAIEQLEGQRGSARRKRRAQLLSGRRGSATGMQLVFANVEMALDICLLSLLFWFAPEGSSRDLFNWLTQSDSTVQSLLTAGAYALVVGVLEPFYVAAGFAMYLNRRVELEAWDIEQEFRRGFR